MVHHLLPRVLLLTHSGNVLRPVDGVHTLRSSVIGELKLTFRSVIDEHVLHSNVMTVGVLQSLHYLIER